MELSHNRGHSGDRGSTECLPASVMNSEVKEHIGGGETSFWDKRAVEQGLVIDSLGLPEMNLCGSSGGGGVACDVEPDCCLLVGIDFRGPMVVDLGLGIYKQKKKKKKKRVREKKGRPNVMGGKMIRHRIFKDQKNCARYAAV